MIILLLFFLAKQNWELEKHKQTRRDKGPKLHQTLKPPIFAPILSDSQASTTSWGNGPSNMSPLKAISTAHLATLCTASIASRLILVHDQRGFLEVFRIESSMIIYVSYSVSQLLQKVVFFTQQVSQWMQCRIIREKGKREMENKERWNPRLRHIGESDSAQTIRFKTLGFVT